MSYLITFIAGMFVGAIFGMFILSLLKDRIVDEEEDDSPFNRDGTPKTIHFKPSDL